jgi:hypothetical protein
MGFDPSDEEVQKFVSWYLNHRIGDICPKTCSEREADDWCELPTTATPPTRGRAVPLLLLLPGVQEVLVLPAVPQGQRRRFRWVGRRRAKGGRRWDGQRAGARADRLACRDFESRLSAFLLWVVISGRSLAMGRRGYEVSTLIPDRRFIPRKLRLERHTSARAERSVQYFFFQLGVDKLTWE